MDCLTLLSNINSAEWVIMFIVENSDSQGRKTFSQIHEELEFKSWLSTIRKMSWRDKGARIIHREVCEKRIDSNYIFVEKSSLNGKQFFSREFMFDICHIMLRILQMLDFASSDLNCTVFEVERFNRISMFWSLTELSSDYLFKLFYEEQRII